MQILNSLNQKIPEVISRIFYKAIILKIKINLNSLKVKQLTHYCSWLPLQLAKRQWWRNRHRASGFAWLRI